MFTLTISPVGQSGCRGGARLQSAMRRVWVGFFNWRQEQRDWRCIRVWQIGQVGWDQCYPCSHTDRRARYIHQMLYIMIHHFRRRQVKPILFLIGIRCGRIWRRNASFIWNKMIFNWIYVFTLGELLQCSSKIVLMNIYANSYIANMQSNCIFIRACIFDSIRDDTFINSKSLEKVPRNPSIDTRLVSQAAIVTESITLYFKCPIIKSIFGKS